jgi:hypothetical protein
VINLGGIKLAFRSYTFEVGAVGPGSNAAPGSVGVPSAPFSVLHQIRHVRIAGNSPFFNQVWENNTLYVQNITGATSDPGTITAEILYFGT